MIDEITLYITKHLLLVILVMTRLSTLLMTLPAIGTGVPKRVRAMLAVLLTFLIAPTVVAMDPEYSPLATSNVDLAILLAREGLIGLLIGSVVQILVTGVQTAGELMTGTGGMQLGDAIDPTTRASMPTLAQLIGLLVIAIMIGIGGHRLLIGSLIDSFDAMPPGRVELHESMLSLVVSQMTTSLGAGIRVGAPVVAALLLCNLITGLISRTLPQINVLAIGLSINALALLAVAALSIGSAGYVFQDEFAGTIARFEQLWTEMAR
ncbi:MAG: flagellar biosynthetic protein FliR [Planctomycetaceae bacterium]